VIVAAAVSSVALFAAGVGLIGFAGGIFSHGTLTLTMNRAPKEQVGLALGAWGAVQATSAGVAVALGGILRDAVGAVAMRGSFGAALAHEATGYTFVYTIEIALLLATIAAMTALVGDRRRSTAASGAMAAAATAPGNAAPGVVASAGATKP
jgi:BCD family chlorophyll transporter-like MFS transporter